MLLQGQLMARHPGSIVPPPPPERPEDEFLSARGLARRLGLPVRPVAVYLSRLTEGDCRREASPVLGDARVEVPNPRYNEPKHLYRVSDVWPLLVIWAAKYAS